VHVFDPGRFPYSAQRRFTPGPAPVAALQNHLHTTGLERVVLVQPSVYGTDNTCLVDALGQLGTQARGVAVVGPDTPDTALAALDAAGVVAARLNLVVGKHPDHTSALAQWRTLDARLPRHWHLQLHVTLDTLVALSDGIARSGRACVLDHLGLPAVAAGTQAPAWQQLLQLAQDGSLFVKLSGPYLSSQTAAPHHDLQPFVQSLATAAPGALLWGSNWPHTQGTQRQAHTPASAIEPFRVVDDRTWLDTCSRWLGAARQHLPHANAVQLYGFDTTAP
jgi:predicted TIM-barrel fold metal-dependent hydrolase